MLPFRSQGVPRRRTIVVTRQQATDESTPSHGTDSHSQLYRLTNREFEVFRIAHRKEAKLLAALAAGGLVLSPAIAATSSKKGPAPVSLSFDPISSFTPANADPKLAASLGTGKGPAVAGPGRYQGPCRCSGADAPRGSNGGDGLGRCAQAHRLQPGCRDRLEAIRGFRRRGEGHAG